MPFNPSERSELELRFEKLFESCFQCPITNILEPQYEVKYKGKTFYIDYVYITDTAKIAIELDGRIKFKDKDYYNYFMARHNFLEIS